LGHFLNRKATPVQRGKAGQTSANALLSYSECFFRQDLQD